MLSFYFRAYSHVCCSLKLINFRSGPDINIIGSVRGQGHKIYCSGGLVWVGAKDHGALRDQVPKTLPCRILVVHSNLDISMKFSLKTFLKTGGCHKRPSHLGGCHKRPS